MRPSSAASIIFQCSWFAPAFRWIFLLLAVSLVGCTATPEFVLMETPAIYHKAAVDPFAHLQDAERDTFVTVFYGTNRQPQDLEGNKLPSFW
jgi:hypothetical protein